MFTAFYAPDKQYEEFHSNCMRERAGIIMESAPNKHEELKMNKKMEFSL